jgi:hypothetical protein
MTENQISLKCIHDLLELQFVIPDYQRGYRWSPQQVEELLEDIWEFRQKDGKLKQEFYCLQPVVVVTMDDGKYSVVDGQQRLTTILIILEVLKSIRKALEQEGKYSIQYQTRKGSEEFLKSFDLSRKDENIDYFHMCQAYEVADSWFEGKAQTVKLNFLNTLLASDEEGMNVKVIWYEVNESHSDPRKIFTRINKGKIPLNNAELIKALFLSKDNFNDASSKELRLRQLEIATEWDHIELTLRDPNSQFWDFITDGKSDRDNRIEFLFDQIAKNTSFKDHYFTFRFFHQWLKENEGDIEKLWKKVKRLFQLLQEWHEDHRMYHLIGFLIATGSRLGDLTESAIEMTKSDFDEHLNELIKSGIKDDPATLDYSDRKEVKYVLLLFNVLTVLSYNDSNYRFQFGRYKRDSWDIEHIHSVASEMPSARAQQYAWLREMQEFTDDPDLENRISFYLNDEDTKDKEEFENIFKDAVMMYSEDKKFDDINDISNLALLDSSTNRGYGNSIFALKRRTIIEKDTEGKFIPPTTKHAFLKYYSNDVDHVQLWGEKDRKNYKDAILDMLGPFVPNNYDEG